jgi:hypothetical protein
MIDPEIWADTELMECGVDAVLVFIGLITQADDEGIVEATPKRVRFKLCRDDISTERIAAILDELDERTLIVRYDKYAWLPGWFKVQKLKGLKPQPTRLQRPPLEAIQAHPEYVAEWRETFGAYEGEGKEKGFIPAEYPVETCLGGVTTGCQLVDNQLATHQQPVASNTKQGKEGNLREVNTKTARARRSTWPENGIEHATLYAFQHITPAMTDNPGQLNAVDKLIKLCRARGDPTKYMPQLVEIYRALTHGEMPGLRNGDKEFWSKQPFTPKAMLSLWDRVVAFTRSKASEGKEAQEFAEDLNRIFAEEDDDEF